jgi:hypothetical protein
MRTVKVTRIYYRVPSRGCPFCSDFENLEIVSCFERIGETEPVDSPRWIVWSEFVTSDGMKGFERIDLRERSLPFPRGRLFRLRLADRQKLHEILEKIPEAMFSFDCPIDT